MLIESLAGLVAVRRRLVALRLGSAMGEPLLRGVVFGLVACRALACGPQIDDLSHASKPQCQTQHSAPITPIRWRGGLLASDPYQNADDAVIWEDTVE